MVSTSDATRTLTRELFFSHTFYPSVEVQVTSLTKKFFDVDPVSPDALRQLRMGGFAGTCH